MNSLLVSLLLMSTLLYEAQGIRLGKFSISSGPNYHDSQEKGEMVIKGSIKGGSGKEIICKDDKINCSGLNRKLMTKTITSTTSTTKSNGEGQNGKKESLSINSTPTSDAQHREGVTGEQYPDIVDIAGMDYSPARRKPPIHN